LKQHNKFLVQALLDPAVVGNYFVFVFPTLLSLGFADLNALVGPSRCLVLS
jgi:hypothetical protein